MKPIPLFGTGLKSYAEIVTAQGRLNCFYEIRPDGDATTIAVRGTPGSTVAFTLPSAPVWGWHIAGSNMYVVAGTTLYQVDPGLNVTVKGSLPTVSRLVSMADNGIHLGIADGVAGYSLVLGSSTFAVIGGNFPNGCVSLTCLDSFAIAQMSNSREFQVSAVLDLTTTGWATIITGTKENTSDNLVAVDAFNGLLILWGQQSIEFWQDVGASPNPFKRINGSSQTWGLAALYSRAEVLNTIIFLGQPKEGKVQVMQLNGYSPTRISTSDIESIIGDFPTYTDAIALTYMQDGHAFYQLTFPAANRSLLYDATTGFWSETQTGLGLTGRHVGNLGIAFNTANYFTDNSTGNVYAFDIHQNQDNGFPIKRQITSRHIYDDGNEMTLASVVLIMDTGKGPGPNEPEIVMQVSRDGGRTFGVERPTPIGLLGEYEYPRAKWDRLGSARDFVLRWTMTDDMDFVIARGDAQIVKGTENRP